MSHMRRAVDRHALQTLSTQFSLDVPIWDDRRRRAIKVSQPEDIAALSIEMTRDGGWDRVTLDSASKEILTTPLVDVLQAGALAAWVQEAHARGLKTYISGGIRSAQHIETAVRAGVDGIGIGTWIHKPGPPGLPGPLDPQRVRDAIRIRNEAKAR
jgi:isopentenyl diphosphate isomerase/L-lactate dehydrogenase-like FMN-dependent dehydrogenase